MGLVVTSMITLGAILPVSVAESEPKLENNVGIMQQK